MRRVGCPGVPAARLKPARCRSKQQRVLIRLIVQRKARGPKLGVQCLGDHPAVRRHDIGVDEAGRPRCRNSTDRAVVLNVQRLLFVGITDTGGEGQLIGKVDIALEIARRCRRVVAQGAVRQQQWRTTRRTGEDGEYIGKVGRVLLIIDIQAGHIFEEPVEQLAVQLELLGELLMPCIVQDGETTPREAPHHRIWHRKVRPAAPVKEVERELLFQVNDTGDQVQRMVAAPDFQVGCHQQLIDIVAEIIVGFAPGDAGAGKLAGAGRKTLPQPSGDKPALAIGRIAGIAVKVKDVFAVVAHVGCGGVPADVRCHLDPCRQPQSGPITVVQPVTGGDILHIALIVLIIARQLQREPLVERQVNRSPGLLLGKAPISDFGIAGDLVTRLGEDDVDGTASGVATKERALRSAQHLDTLNIKKAEIIGVLTAEIDIIDIGTNRRVECRNRFGIAKTTQIIGVG